MPAARRLVLAAVSALVLLAPAAAQAEAGPVDPRGADVTTALRLAAHQWGAQACDGAVDVRWAVPADSGTNAVASWAGTPQRRTACVVALNPRASWDWPKLCTVVVHEVGHLLGHDHDEDGLMSAVYGPPLTACAATPEPQGAFAAAAPALAPVAPAAPAAAPAPAAPVALALPVVADDEEEAAAPRSAIEAASLATPVRSRAARRSGRAGQRRGRGARRASPRAARTR